MGTSFSDVKAADRMRRTIEKIATRVVNQLRPDVRIGQVHHFDNGRQLAWIQFPGEDDTSLVQVRTSMLQRPTRSILINGDDADVVRVAGKPGQYYVLDFVKGTPRPTLMNVPIGGVIEWPAGPSVLVPDGWLEANGQAVSRTTWADLFAVYGTQHGAGDGSTTFNVYNHKGRVAVGFDASQSEFDTIGETGGEKTHVLTVAEMPAHTHTTDINFNLINSRANGSETYNVDSAASSPTGSTGGGGAHNNLQPYVTSRFIIKAREDAALGEYSTGSNSVRTSDISTGINNILVFNAGFGQTFTTFDQEFERVDFPTTPPSPFIWLNQDASIQVYKENFGAGVLSHLGSVATGDVWRMIARSLTGAPADWTAYARISWAGNAATYSLAGWQLRESSSGKFLAMHKWNNSDTVEWARWNSYTSVNTVINTNYKVHDMGKGAIWRLKKVGTTYTWGYSVDEGITWFDIMVNYDLSPYFTPDQICFGMNNTTIGLKSEMAVHWLRVR